MKAKHGRNDLEEGCRKVFDNHLRHGQTLRNIEWKRYPNGPNLPPDFNVTLDGKIFAVEVTGLTIIRGNSANSVDSTTYEKSRQRLAYGLTQKALGLGILKGCYVLNFYTKWIIPLDKKVRGQIEKQAFEYIRNSKDKDSENWMDIRYDHILVCKIGKYRTSKNQIKEVFTAAEWTDSPEVVIGASDMIQRAVLKKVDKLQKGNILQPWILLLYNANPFASESIYEKCENLKRIEKKENFDRIFIVMSPESGFDFYLNNQISTGS